MLIYIGVIFCFAYDIGQNYNQIVQFQAREYRIWNSRTVVYRNRILSKEWRENHPEQYREHIAVAKAKWQDMKQNDPEKYRAQLEKNKERMRKWRLLNPEKYKARREAEHTKYIANKIDCPEKYHLQLQKNYDYSRRKRAAAKILKSSLSLTAEQVSGKQSGLSELQLWQRKEELKQIRMTELTAVRERQKLDEGKQQKVQVSREHNILVGKRNIDRRRKILANNGIIEKSGDNNSKSGINDVYLGSIPNMGKNIHQNIHQMIGSWKKYTREGNQVKKPAVELTGAAMVLRIAGVTSSQPIVVGIIA